MMIRKKEGTISKMEMEISQRKLVDLYIQINWQILTIFIGEIPMAQCTLTSISTSADVFRYLGEKLNLNQAWENP